LITRRPALLVPTSIPRKSPRVLRTRSECHASARLLGYRKLRHIWVICHHLTYYRELTGMSLLLRSSVHGLPQNNIEVARTITSKITMSANNSITSVSRYSHHTGASSLDPTFRLCTQRRFILSSCDNFISARWCRTRPSPLKFKKSPAIDTHRGSKESLALPHA
jgi:hypothetical protein